jgi:Flp pilus assembly protein TadD
MSRRMIPSALGGVATLALMAGPASADPAIEVVDPDDGATAPATTTPQAEAPARVPPLRLSGLRMPSRVVGQRGHARILVGARLNRSATVTVQISSLKDGVLRRTVTQDRRHRKGRAFILLDAVNDAGFQLTQGVYRITVSARDPRGRLSNELGRNFRLRLTAPRGRFDAYTVPLLPAFRRTHPIGQLVAVVAPGGTAATAGIRRGDIVTKIGRYWITTPGAMATAKRALLARRKIPVRVIRDGAALNLRMTPDPDWTARPDYGRSLRVASRRAPNDYAIHYARVAEMIDQGETTEAARALAGLRRSWRLAAPGQYLNGRIQRARNRQKPALGAFIRATARDPEFSEALIAQGALLTSRGRPERALVAFRRAAEADPRNATAHAFEAYVHIGEDSFEEALAAGNRALKIDPLFPDAQITRGIALVAAGRKAQGLQALRRGVLDLGDRTRAQQIAHQNIEPADP